jgi:hypothetical protein
MIGNWNDLDLNANAWVPRYGDISIDSDSNIYRSIDLLGSVGISIRDDIEISGTANIFGSKIIESDAVVKRSENLDAISDILVRRFGDFTINGNAYVSKDSHVDIDANSIIRKWKYSNLNSSVLTRRSSNNTIDGNANIFKDIELLGSSSIRRTRTKDLSTTSKVRRSGIIDLSGNVTVTRYIELSSSALVRRTGNKDLSSSSKINKFITLLGQANIIKTLDLPSSVKARLTNNFNLTGLSNIRPSLNLDGNATIRRKDLELIGSANIIYNTDLISNATIVRYKDINGTVVVRETSDVNLYGQAIIRQLDITELDGSNYVFGFHYKQFDGEAIIRQIGRFDDFISIVDVTSGARYWIPNVHGVDKFTFDNRKLPRVWKKQLFIPQG